MKKLLSMLLALTMLLPLLATAEGTTDVGVIGGADGPTAIYLANGGVRLPGMLGEAAVAAGRRVVSTVKFTELSGVPMETEEEAQVLNDILNALTVVQTQQGDEGGVTVQLSGKDVLTLGVALSGKDTYISSDLLGGTIVVAEDEVEGLVNSLLTLLVNMGLLTEEDLELNVESITEMTVMLEAYQAYLGQLMALLEQADTFDYTALMNMVDLIAANVEVIESPAVPRACDPAATGVKVSVNNEQMQQIMLGYCQFLQDNPALKDALGIMMGLPTEEEIAESWEENKEFYQEYGFYATEEEFRADMMTMDDFMAELTAMAGTQKVIEGEYVITVYTDEQDLPVYMALDLPIYAEDVVYEDGAEPQTVGYVVPISLIYTRQTLADAVDHVCNISVDGKTLSINVQTAENRMALTVDAIAFDGSIAKLMDMTVQTQPAAEENTPDVMTAEMNLLYDGEVPQTTLLLEGESLFTDDRSYMAGKLSIAVAELGEVGTLTMSSDTAIDGVDFTGKSIVTMESQAVGMRMAVEADYLTTDPVESIMAGQVVRPAELDENAFSQWITGIQTNFYTWMANAMGALPESAIQMLFAPAEQQ
ncbi:MAG: hypothetical protein ACI4WX_10025 [Aristaeellaceae bacterium]